VTAHASTTAFLHTLIDRFPGLHFRELQRRTGLAVGSLDYQLWQLQRRQLVFDERIWAKRRYFSAAFPADDRRLTGLLRERIVRDIAAAFIQGRPVNAGLCRQLRLAKSTVSWYLGRLAEEGVLSRGGRQYALADPARIRDLLDRHRETFSEKLLNNFVDLWER
jgi:predicted transcriptional regulator